MWVVMNMQKFEFDTIPSHILPFPISYDMGKIIGYLPCYQTKEDALKDFPDGDIKEARFKEGC